MRFFLASVNRWSFTDMTGSTLISTTWGPYLMRTNVPVTRQNLLLFCFCSKMWLCPVVSRLTLYAPKPDSECKIDLSLILIYLHLWTCIYLCMYLCVGCVGSIFPHPLFKNVRSCYIKDQGRYLPASLSLTLSTRPMWCHDLVYRRRLFKMAAPSSAAAMRRLECLESLECSRPPVLNLLSLWLYGTSSVAAARGPLFMIFFFCRRMVTLCAHCPFKKRNAWSVSGWYNVLFCCSCLGSNTNEIL